MKKLNSIVVDPYLNDDMCIDRLVENWRLHNGIIIAFDFDNTIFDYYDKGYRYDKVIAQIHTFHRLILQTNAFYHMEDC